MKDKREMHLSNLMVDASTSCMTVRKVSVTVDDDEGKAAG